MSITINGTTGVSGVDGSSTTPAFQGTDTDTGLFYSANTVSVSAGGSKVATINAYGIGLGTGSPSSGIGITFPATQSASSDANTLDDYEEGTFTPAWSYTTPGTVSVGYSSRSGTYTRIGDLVYFRLAMVINSFSKGTASGNPIISGLPFTCANTSRNYPPLALYAYSAPKNTTAGYQSAPYIEQNGTFLYMQDFGNNTAVVNYADPNGSNNEYYISGCYKAA